MGLFGKKKLTLEEILEGLAGLTPDEKKQVKAKMEETPAPESPAEPENTETTPEPEAPEIPEEQKAEEIPEEPSVEEESQAPAEEAVPDEAPAEEAPVTEEPASETAPEMNEAETNNETDILGGLTERVQELENSVAEFRELKEKMEEYVTKQKEAFGYKSESTGTHKDYSDMSAAELKAHILGN